MSRFPKSPWFSLDCRSGKRLQRSRTCIPRTTTLFAFALVIFFTVSTVQWILPASPPHPDLPPRLPCRDAKEGYVLEEMGICTNTCGKLCFPRVHGICFHHTEVVLCDGQPPVPQDIIDAWGVLPDVMRFYMEKPRRKVPVRHGACAEGKASKARWITGLQMVADLTLMPTGRVGPNPHHEAEKVVPAIVFSQLSEFENSSLYWFANPDDPLMISKWSLGLLDVFSKDLKVEYMAPVALDQPPICFEDAILFAGVTNSAYMPNARIHDWFRRRILEHCDIPIMKANVPVRDVVIIHRPNSSRNIQNYEAVKDIMEAKLGVSVKMAVPGPWTFCEQVKPVAEADMVLTPHGSHNANLLAIRPGSMVMEVFPLLYYVNWYKNYLHAGSVSHHELFGTWPSENSMPLLMRLYAYLYGWRGCFWVRKCMNFGKSQGIFVDEGQLESQLQTLISKCRVVVPHSTCHQSIT